jgi:hypothetical protein
MIRLNQRLRFLLIVGILASYSAVIRAQSISEIPEDDVQFWNDTTFAVPLGSKVDFVLLGTFRLGDNLTTAIDGRWGAGWVIKPHKYLSFNPFFYHRKAKAPNAPVDEVEDRLTLAATFRYPIGKLSLVHRSAFEHRWRRPQRDAWRYRARGQIEYPFTVGKTKLTGFVANEVFYDWSVRDWVRNRFAVGISRTFNKHVTLDLYILRQNDGRSRPGDITVLGSQLRLRM